MKKHIRKFDYRSPPGREIHFAEKVFPDRKYVSLDDPFLEQQAKEAGSIFANVGICVGTKNWRQYGIWVYSGNS